MAEPFENKQGITRIKMDCRVKCFCPMGNDWYSADVAWEAHDPKFIPDYCAVEEFLRTEVDGRGLILEDVCEQVYNWLRLQVKGGELKVSVYSDDAVHPAVTVEKSDF